MKPPQLARLLLRLATLRRDRDFLLKDLEEELARLAGERGPAAARRWYWRQALSSLLPLAARRLEAGTPRRAPRISTEDVRQAGRWLVRHPRASVAAVLTLAIALGAAGAAGTILHGIVLRPLPFPDESRVVHLWSTGPDTENARRPSRASIPVVSLQDLDDWRRASRLLSAVSGYTPETYTLTGRGEARRIRAMRVGPDFDRVLGVRPAAGRPFAPHEFQAGAERVAILTYGFWMREFGGSPDVVGQSLSLDERPYLVAGVLPDLPVEFPAAAHDIWVPLIAQPGVFWQNQRGTGWVRAVGRVAPDATVSAAEAELSAIARGLADAYPASNARRTGVAVEPIREALVGDTRPVVLLVAGAIAAVLLVAGANLVNLLLSHAEERRREFAVRRALGAGSARLRTQVFIEALLLAIAGGLLALAVAPAMVRAFVSFYPAPLPAAYLAPTRAGLLAMTGLSVLAAIVLALPQFRQAGRGAVTHELRSGRRQTSGRADRRLRSLLVSAQVAFSIVLIATSVLFVRTFAGLAAVDPGFRSDGVLVFGLVPPASRYGQAEETVAFHRAAIEAVAAVPGVESAAMAIGVPFVSSGWSFPVTPPGGGEGDRVLVRANMASDGYYDALRIPIVQGRAFSETEQRTGAPVAIVTKSAVRLLPDPSRPIGQRVPYSGQEWEIVGVAGDVHQGSLESAGAPQLVLPWSLSGRRPQTMVVRVAAGDPLAALPAIRARLAALDPAVPMADPRRLSDVVDETLADERFRAVLVAGLAGVALLLAALGVYSVTAYAVARQEREHGVRLALGASPGALARTVLSTAIRPAAAGVVVGLLAAWTGAQAIRGFLYGVDARDPLTLAATAAMLLIVTVLSALAPARRAARTDPASLLRAE